MAVNIYVHTQYKFREVNIPVPHVFIPNKPAAALAVMCSETVKLVAKKWDVENVTDQDIVSVEANYNGALSQSGCKYIIPHTNAIIGDPMV